MYVYDDIAEVLALLSKKTKLGTKIMDCVFMGYALNNSVYGFLVHKSEIPVLM